MKSFFPVFILLFVFIYIYILCSVFCLVIFLYLDLFPFPSMGHCVVLEKKPELSIFNISNVNKVMIQTLKYFFHN